MRVNVVEFVIDLRGPIFTFCFDYLRIVEQRYLGVDRRTSWVLHFLSKLLNDQILKLQVSLVQTNKIAPFAVLSLIYDQESGP